VVPENGEKRKKWKKVWERPERNGGAIDRTKREGGRIKGSDLLKTAKEEQRYRNWAGGTPIGQR